MGLLRSRRLYDREGEDALAQELDDFSDAGVDKTPRTKVATLQRGRVAGKVGRRWKPCQQAAEEQVPLFARAGRCLLAAFHGLARFPEEFSRRFDSAITAERDGCHSWNHARAFMPVIKEAARLGEPCGWGTARAAVDAG